MLPGKPYNTTLAGFGWYITRQVTKPITGVIKAILFFCMEGEFVTHLKDGAEHLLKKGMSYQTSDDEVNPHMSTSENGCTLLIVDGDFFE